MEQQRQKTQEEQEKIEELEQCVQILEDNSAEQMSKFVVEKTEMEMTHEQQ